MCYPNHPHAHSWIGKNTETRNKLMKVFISWSGEKSWKIAITFRDWLPSVIQSVEPYVSSEDIDKGTRWSTDIAKELEDSTFGILCVTKENLEAPWLSFEAGALSKTIEKSYVAPFLFDIKRSEVKGPILQFQSTIFQKDDIKKMVQTINRACGEAGISEHRLDRAFEVWYPSLENDLKQVAADFSSTPDEIEQETTNSSSDILEEILELSRDNQRLLKNPDSKLYDEITNVKDVLSEMVTRNEMAFEKRRVSRKNYNMVFEDILHNAGKRGTSYAFLMTLSLVRDECPWLYDIGKELIDTLKTSIDSEEKDSAIRDFKNLVDFTFGHSLMRDIFGRNKESMMLYRDFPYVIMKCLEDLSAQYI